MFDGISLKPSHPVIISAVSSFFSGEKLIVISIYFVPLTPLNGLWGKDTGVRAFMAKMQYVNQQESASRFIFSCIDHSLRPQGYPVTEVAGCWLGDTVK